MSRVRIEPACLAHASFIAANMRDADRAEIMCQVPDGTKTYEVAGMLLNSGDAFVAYYDDEPVLFFGAHPLNVCTLDAWAMGTDKTRRCIVEVSRYMFATYRPLAIEQGYRTMECRSHVEHAEAHRWLASTGAVVNGQPFVYGKNGEEFVLFRWDHASLETAAKRYKVAP